MVTFILVTCQYIVSTFIFNLSYYHTPWKWTQCLQFHLNSSVYASTFRSPFGTKAQKSAYLSRKQCNILRVHAIVRSIIHVNLLREFLLPRKRLAENPNVCPSTSSASSLMVTYVSSALLRFDFCEHSSCIFELCFGSRIHLQEYTCRGRNTNPVLWSCNCTLRTGSYWMFPFCWWLITSSMPAHWPI